MDKLFLPEHVRRGDAIIRAAYRNAAFASISYPTDLYAAYRVGQRGFHWDGRTDPGAVVTGTATYTVAPAGSLAAQIATGATISSNCSFSVPVINGGGAQETNSRVERLRYLKLVFDWQSVITDTTGHFYYSEIGQLGTTTNHVGLRWTGGSLFFTVGNPTTEATVLLAGPGTAVWRTFDFVCDWSIPRVDCYQDAVYLASISTILPTHVANRYGTIAFDHQNDIAANKNFSLCSADAVINPV